MKKTISIITTALLVIVLLLAFALVGVRLFGLAPYTVLSGSMEPTYHVGSLIYVTEVEPQELEVGDPLTYVIDGGTVVTHRIIEKHVDPDNPADIRFKTKGDNNNIEDGELVRAENILGKPVFTIPLMGYVAFFIQTPPSSYIAIGMCIIIVLLTFLPDLMDKLFEEEDKKAEATVLQDGGDPAEETATESQDVAEKDERPPPDS